MLKIRNERVVRNSITSSGARCLVPAASLTHAERLKGANRRDTNAVAKDCRSQIVSM